MINYLPSLLNQPIQFYSCFISYSSKDQEFADRLHADLQNKGVRCWFAPHDLAIGAKIIDAIDEAIRLRDKVLLILSEHSVASDWVEEEVTRALDEERSRKTTVLFPIRVDDAVLNTTEAWARGLRIQRHIGDFCLWKDHDAYQKALERVLRDLKVAAGGAIKPVQSPRSCPCARGADQGAQKLRRRGILQGHPCMRGADPMPPSPPRSHRIASVQCGARPARAPPSPTR